MVVKRKRRFSKVRCLGNARLKFSLAGKEHRGHCAAPGKKADKHPGGRKCGKRDKLFFQCELKDLKITKKTQRRKIVMRGAYH